MTKDVTECLQQRCFVTKSSVGCVTLAVPTGATTSTTSRVTKQCPACNVTSSALRLCIANYTAELLAKLGGEDTQGKIKVKLEADTIVWPRVRYPHKVNRFKQNVNALQQGSLNNPRCF